MHPAFRPAPRPFVFAHRGARAVVPENTLLAFDRAIDLGADGLELDVRLSRDGCPVVHHDERLDRTTDARGAVGARTAAELAGVDAAFHFGADAGHPFRGQGIGIPTLGEVLTRYSGVPLIVEMKGASTHLARAALEVVRAADALEWVCFGGFSLAPLAALRRMEPAAVTSAARVEFRAAMRRSWVGWPLGAVAYRVCQAPLRFAGRRVLSRRIVRTFRRAGIPTQIWTVNEDPDVSLMAEWGVDAVITDRPDAVKRVLDTQP